MPDWPTGPLFAFLTVVVFCRAGGTYLLGRGARGLADRRTPLAERPAVRQAERVVERLGALAVVLSFLTIGVQSAIHAAAGSLRMPPDRYLPALAVGSLVWAAIYVTVGLAALEALWGGRWWLLPLVLLGLLALTWSAGRWLTSRGAARGP